VWNESSQTEALEGMNLSKKNEFKKKFPLKQQRIQPGVVEVEKAPES